MKKKKKNVGPLPPLAAFRTGPVDPSRTLCCKCFIIWLNFNYFPGLLSPAAVAAAAAALSVGCEGKGSEVAKGMKGGPGGRRRMTKYFISL